MRLFNKNFNIVVIGQMISIFGNAVLRFALPLYILKLTGSPTIFGVTLATSTIPTLLFSPLGGILADRKNKRNLMVILDTITGIIVCISGFLLAVGPIVLIITLLMISLSIIQSFYQPVVQASIPVIVPKEDLEKANGIVNLVNALSSLLGPVLGGILFGNFGIWPIMITGSICFLLSATMELYIKIDFVKQTKCDSTIKMIISDFKTSINFLVKDKPIMFEVMTIVSLINFFLTSMILIGLPAMILVKLKQSEQLYGYTQGAMMAGMILGGVLISILGKRVKTQKVYILLLLTSISLIPMGIAFNLMLPKIIIYLIISLCCFIMMVLITMFSITMMSFAQRETPEHLIGKVIAYILVLSQCTLPIGQAIYGFIFDIGMNYISLIVYITALCCVMVSIYSKRVFKKLVIN